MVDQLLGDDDGAEVYQPGWRTQRRQRRERRRRVWTVLGVALCFAIALTAFLNLR